MPADAVRISARSDYALRAGVELARAGESGSTSDALALAQGISQPFLQNILGDMRRAGLVRATKSRGGGYWLACPADQISAAAVLDAVDGPLVRVHGVHPDELRYPASAETVADLWVAVRANVAAMLGQVNLHDMAAGSAAPPAILPPTRRPGGRR